MVLEGVEGLCWLLRRGGSYRQVEQISIGREPHSPQVAAPAARKPARRSEAAAGTLGAHQFRAGVYARIIQAAIRSAAKRGAARDGRQHPMGERRYGRGMVEPPGAVTVPVRMLDSSPDRRVAPNPRHDEGWGLHRNSNGGEKAR